MRLDRQARVGILRNLREPPRLPPRKAPLTGTWLDMRSRRRLQRHGPAGMGSVNAGGAAAVTGEGDLPPRAAPGDDAVAMRLRRSLRDLPDDADGAGVSGPEAGGAEERAEPVAGRHGAAPGRALRVAAGLVAGLAVAFAGALVAVWMRG